MMPEHIKEICNCNNCKEKEKCGDKNCMRRIPIEYGGLGYCKNLNNKTASIFGKSGGIK